MKDKLIKDIYNITFDLSDIPEENKCEMNEWYYKLINKSYEQLDLFDVTRMIIQKLFLELAINKAKIFIAENPFCGERYEGELLELLFEVDDMYLKKHRAFLSKILKKAFEENKTYEWLCEEEREEFNDLILKFTSKINDQLK